MELLAGTLMVLDTALDTESETEQPQLFATDWRGNAFNVGTRIVWHNGNWGVGKITRVYSDYRGRALLSVMWEARGSEWKKDKVGSTTHNIWTYHCTVWPVQDD